MPELPIGALASSFSSPVRHRGERYLRDGRVSIDEASDCHVLATVHGSEDYEVDIAEEGDRLLSVRCACPYFLDGSNCKHIWATLLAAKEVGAFAALASKRGPIRIEQVFDDEPDDHRVSEDAVKALHGTRESPASIHEVEAPLRRPPTVDRTRSAWSPPRPSWKDLAGVSLAGAVGIPPSRTRRESRYVISVEDSKRAGGLAVFLENRSVSVNGVPMSPWRRVDLDEARRHFPDGKSPLAAILTASRANYAYVSPTTPVIVPAPFVAEACRWLAEVPGTEIEGPTHERVPLRLDEGGRWTFELHAEHATRGALTVRGVLRREEERRSLSDSWLLIAGSVVVWPEAVAILATSGGFEWIAALRAHGSLPVPRAEVESFLEFAAEEQVPVTLPDSLRFERVAVPPAIGLKLDRPRKDYGTPRASARLFFTYAESQVDGFQTGRAIVDSQRKRVLVRDGAAERTAAERLVALGFRSGNAWSPGYEIAPAKLPAAARALVAEGWRVEGEGKVYRSATAFAAIVSSGIDWFDLQASASFGDEAIPLPRLLAALRRGEHTIALGDGTVGLLPEEWLARWSNVASIGDVEGESVRFTRAQGTVLDALLASESDVRFDERFAELRAKLRSFDGIRPARAPSKFRGELREYQRLGLGWMAALAELGLGGCLADDMGLGKTVQVLAHLVGEARGKRGAKATATCGPSLVVAPKSVVFNWRDEAARFAPTLRVLVHAGAGRTISNAHFADHDVVLTTYGTLRRDIAALREVTFHYVILDEAQAIKNASSASAKAARLVKARHRLALSGTPIENHLGELWSLFEFLNPGMLGAVSAFKRFTGAQVVEGTNVSMLAHALRPFVLRRTKREVARELPDRVEQIVHCDLEKEQRAMYEELKAYYRRLLLSRARRDGIKKMTTNILEALLRLRQAACHPGLIDPKLADGTSSKLETLLAQLESTLSEGHKALVFSQFTSLLAIVRDRLEKKGIAFEYLDGKTRDRAERVERFQRDDGCRVFLISLKAGGVGLNLTAAEYVFLLDPWWNPAVEAQAIDRAHRIGQSRTVFAYRLIASDTVEQRVLDLQQQKRALVAGLLGDGTAGGGLQDMTAEDLEMLLS